jgi:2-keto-3-deoxy-6-phosphogluconate aldolase
MSKRILNCCASDFAAMGREELLHAIAASEGRTLMAETIGAVPPLLGDVTNAELAAAMGADFLLLNLFDVQKPAVQGLPDHAPADTLRLVKQLTGRPVGINLEPGEAPAHSADPWALTPGRCATAENARLAADLGADLILLTGNPGNGIGNAGILRALREIRAAVGSRLILAAGKMHASGVLSEGAESILTPEEIDDFAAAGADIILLPAPGTVPGVTLEWAGARVQRIHRCGCLALTSVGTSQEGADTDTIRRIALLCKQAGADIHHLGDSGLPGISSPENLMAYGVAIRGVRHTWHRMACSIRR